MTDLLVALDAHVLQTLYALRDPSMAQTFIWITGLGSTIVIGILAACVGLAFALRGYFAYLTGLLVSLGGSAATVFILKEIVARSRPSPSFQAYIETGYSFPSGHAALSLALYGFLAYVVWHTTPTGHLRVLVPLSAAVIVMAVGFSRLYLGVHYATDVLASFIIASIFISIGIFVAKRIQRH